MDTCDTCKITVPPAKGNPQGYVVINQSDFDAKKHQLYEEPKAGQDGGKASEAAKPKAGQDGGKASEAAKPKAGQDGGKASEAAKPKAGQDGGKE